jgi:[ribosomal protein S18]-alanine N-acetyltransferase
MLLEVAAGNAPARALYAAAGFAEVGKRRRYYPDGSDALVLAAALVPDVL